MRITVIVPIYNVEQYIAECAESLFRQTYPDLEYVFCDDCTPDRSIEVLQEVMARHPERGDHVRIVRQEKNSGLGAARARLVQEVRTEYFCIVDSDDVLPLDSIEILARRMEETGADVVGGAYVQYDGTALSAIHLPDHSSDAAYRSKLQRQNAIEHHVWGKLYKSEVLEKVSPMFFEGIDYCEDYCATVRLAAVTKRAWTDKVVYHYRVNNNTSYTNNINVKAVRSLLRANREALRFFLMRGHLPYALEIGLLNCYRECHRSGVPMKEADDVLQYFPEHLRAKLLYAMFHSSIPYPITNTLYRILRAII